MSNDTFDLFLDAYEDEGWDGGFLKLLAFEFQTDLTHHRENESSVPEGSWLEIVLTAYRNPGVLDDIEKDVAFVRRQLALRDSQLIEKGLEKKFQASLEAPQ